MTKLSRFSGLKLWQKLAIIVIALGLPALVLAIFYIGSMSYDGRFARAELDGLEYIDPLDKLDAAFNAERGMASAVAAYGTVAQKAFQTRIEQNRARIEEAIKIGDEADKKYGAKFGTTEKWKEVKAEWAAIREADAKLKPEEIAAKYDKLMTSLRAVQTDVSEKSNLILDPILVTYYLQDNITLRGQPLIDSFGKARLLGYELAMKKEADLESRFRLTEILGQMSAARAGFDGNVTILQDRDPVAFEKMSAKHREAVAAADEFTNLLQKQIIEASPGATAKITISPEEVWKKGTAALESYLQVNDDDLPILRDKLTVRYGAANTRIYVSAALISLSLLIAGALVYGIAFGIARQTNAITRTFAAIKQGRQDARAEVVSTDELGQVAMELNTTLAATAKLIQSQDERDRIQSSIMKLLDEVGGVAQGDLTTQAEVTTDLTGAIADAFNYMIDQLREIIGNVQRATLQVTESAGDIYESTQKLAGGAEEQATQIVGATRAVEEMAVSVRQVSETATESAAVAGLALTSARQGNESVKNTIAGMGRIREQVQETAKRMKRLGESSQEIGQIIQLIDDIADRTSILALNASIQAAMAGEAGRGFAVVAEEVERLADRSTDATKKIATLVKAIQSETTEAVTAMEKGIHEVVEGSKLATQAGQALEEIEDVSGRLAGLIQQISEASGQQAAASDGVTKAMTDINSVTRRAATGTRQAAAAVQSLAELAEDLRASVATFKLPEGSAPVLPQEPEDDLATELGKGISIRPDGANGYHPRELAGSRF